MAWKVLKQFNAQSATVWVEKVNSDDTVDKFSTKTAANAKMAELEAADNSRLYKVVKVKDGVFYCKKREARYNLYATTCCGMNKVTKS